MPVLGRESCENSSSEMTRMTPALRLVEIEPRTPSVGNSSINRFVLGVLPRLEDVSTHVLSLEASRKRKSLRTPTSSVA